jgi:polar amino acid transport system substrate-binding protein
MATSAILLATALASSAPAGQAMPALTITAEFSPPASMLAGEEVIGREGDKIREMLQRSGISYKIGILPWKRA